MFTIKRLLFFLIIYFIGYEVRAQYNALWIPDTLSGTEFHLHMRDTSHQFFNSGPATTTMAINGSWWGPTLFFNKGDTVQLNVMNEMMDTSTLHWHGIHLPAIMDGGPHQTIPPMTMWSPYYKVMNNAATYWYHPHLHMMTEHQVNMGLGGFIIIRDSIESSLNLPRTYGVDDIPLALTDRRFDTVTNEIVMSHFGDTMIVNGTLNPEYSLPAQIVRLRIVNAVGERFYNLGLSNNASFRIISTDGGLLNAPVAQNRFIIAPGERVEILVNLNGMQGQNIDLVAYNNSLPGDMAGASPGTGIFYSALGGRQFNILRINVTAQTANPVTTFPTTLTTNVFYAESSATNTRHITMSDAGSNCPPVWFGCGWLDSAFFDMNVINHSVVLNTTEIWEIENLSSFAHPFHIHNIQFYILDRNGIPPPMYERGWKDVMNVRAGVTARFITRFADYADSTMPYMYHCHNLFHEDAGMMGQFVVIDTTPPVLPPQISFTASDSTICAGECIDFSASTTSAVDSWDWNFENGMPATGATQQITVCYSQPGTYDVSLSASNSAGSDAVTALSLITVHPAPTVSLSADDNEVCENDQDVILTGSPAGGNYIGQNVTGNLFSPASPGTYSIQYDYTDTNGCSNNDSVQIVVNSLPAVTLSADDSVCIDAAGVVLTGNPAGGSYSGTAVTGNSFDPATAGTGNFTVTYIYTDGNGCVNNETTEITVTPLPVVNITAPDSICLKQGTAVLNGTPSGGFFSGNGVSGSIFDPQVTGTGSHMVYYIYSDASSCSNIDSALIMVNPYPAVILSAPASVCLQNGPVLLSGDPPGGNYFGPGVSGNMFDPVVAGVDTFVLSYTYTDNNNCVGVDSVDIIVEVCTGVTEMQSNGLYIYPNPSDGLITVATNASEYVLEIISSDGKIVMVKKITGSRSQNISISDLNAGIYMIRIVSGDSTSFARLVKQ